MATLNNGTIINFKGRTFKEIGELLVDKSENKDGRGIELLLTQEEEGAFVEAGGFFVGRSISNLMVDAIAARGDEATFSYKYSNLKFTTK